MSLSDIGIFGLFALGVLIIILKWKPPRFDPSEIPKILSDRQGERSAGGSPR